MAKVIYKGSGGGHRLVVEAMTFARGTGSERVVTRWAATGGKWSKGSLWTERTAEQSLLAMVEEVRSCHPRAAIRIVPEPGSGAKIPVGLDIVAPTTRRIDSIEVVGAPGTENMTDAEFQADFDRRLKEWEQAQSAGPSQFGSGVAQAPQSEALTVCPNCEQWQRGENGGDCLNECRRRGFAPPAPNHDDRTGLLLMDSNLGPGALKAWELVPRLGGLHSQRARIDMTEEEYTRYMTREDRDAPFRTVDLNTGKTVEIRRAACGLRCKCDATVKVVRA